MAKVIASSLRKGNVVDLDGKLYVILTAQNIHPGKGTPVTQLDLRRISDGVKISERYRTTEQVERAFVESQEHSFLYGDDTGYHFMNPDSYEQVTVTKDVIGDQAVYLQEGMNCMLSLHEGIPIAIELPQRVTLEITESAFGGRTDDLVSLVERLASLGVRLSIDDFGTGYSSLSHLQRLPIDILKIDRTFVDAIASDEHATALARTVVSLGELMSLDIVAEGIENQEQAERLLALGCDAGQGYYFGLPMAAEDLPAYADRYRSLSTV